MMIGNIILFSIAKMNESSAEPFHCFYGLKKKEIIFTMKCNALLRIIFWRRGRDFSLE